jgi:hypothetical protein
MNTNIDIDKLVAIKFASKLLSGSGASNFSMEIEKIGEILFIDNRPNSYSKAFVVLNDIDQKDSLLELFNVYFAADFCEIFEYPIMSQKSFSKHIHDNNRRDFLLTVPYEVIEFIIYHGMKPTFENAVILNRELKILSFFNN